MELVGLSEIEKICIRAALKILNAIAETRADRSEHCDAIVQKCSGAYHDKEHHIRNCRKISDATCAGYFSTVPYHGICGLFFMEVLYKLAGKGILLW